jgi:hypothetical protein
MHRQRLHCDPNKGGQCPLAGRVLYFNDRWLAQSMWGMTFFTGGIGISVMKEDFLGG